MYCGLALNCYSVHVYRFLARIPFLSIVFRLFFEFGGVYVSLFLFTCRSSQFNTLPKRKSTENMFAIGTGAGSTGDGVMTGRSLPGEKQPRSGSWNTHKRIASPVLPNKYLTPDKQRYAL